MAEIPFLGCKISLISKCDIRYEGILYCVDPKESTIALSKVKSYGTETRADPNNFVAPKNDIYDIIIFRASDVKDLRVDQPDTFQDPAIISAQQSSSFARQAPSTTTATTTNITAGANDGSLPTQRQQPSQQAARQQHPQQPSQQANKHQQQIQQQNQQHPQQKPLLPFLPANKSNVRRDDGRADSDMRRHDRRNEDRRHDDRRMGNGDSRREPDGRRDGGGGGGGGSGRPNNKLSRGGYENNRNNAASRHNGNNSNNYSRRGPNNNRDENSKGGGYRRGPMTGGRRPRSGDRSGPPRGPRKVVPLKFEGEYDFDEANKLFAELDSKFKGLKLGKGDKEAELSGDVNASKSPTGRSESGSGYDSEDNKDGDSKDEGSVTDEYYDKSKSFFDNISCEASERSQGKVGKTDWRKERKINAETFGISANYRRGGYRGRVYGANGYRR